MQAVCGRGEGAPKWILVTGGTGAIGSEVVRALCAEAPAAGWQVAANYKTDLERAGSLHRETGCRLVRADVASEDEVAAMFAEIDGLWAVVHAAAVSRNALLLQQKAAAWQETLRVNAGGAFLVTREALRILPEGGRLILLASRVGEEGNRGQSAYAASKAAVIALARAAARESGERGVCVNAICPGLVPSALTADLAAERYEAFARRSVFGELGSGSDVAGTVKWLLGAEARGISGQIIHSDSRV